MQSFSIADDKTLIDLIRSAKQRLVYVAPGVSEPIADAIAERLPEQGSLNVSVILDLDPEVYRLGYGTMEGFKRLQTAMEDHAGFVRSQPGLRIGLVVSDETVMVFTPVPLLIEAGSESASKPNAIVLSEHPAEQLATATGTTSETLPSQAEIGQAPVTPEQIKATASELERMPPKRFDIQRVQRIFSSRVQYVEIEVTGYRIAGRSISLPTDLLIADRETQKRLKNSFKLFDKPEATDVEIVAPVVTEDGKWKDDVKLPYGQRFLEEDRRELTERWLFSVQGFGMIILRENRAQFDTEIEAFCARVEAYGKVVKDFLQGKDQKALEPILGGLVDSVMQAPPRVISDGVLISLTVTGS
ncbi:hypothetical protein U5801_19125 [Lamprobacter modestohalophilus]|uniref:hypothetical protein n=1 Tax=Lamprobacter modestohalophilus TaxID=1064514 RepID=UPI002ADEF3A5|nr:hypothetical protein [Lamprobacter modestohalophilus]MEA1051902.1 hypothetical protein [Lamprobacter modestohalophilus]